MCITAQFSWRYFADKKLWTNACILHQLCCINQRQLAEYPLTHLHFLHPFSLFHLLIFHILCTERMPNIANVPNQTKIIFSTKAGMRKLGPKNENSNFSYQYVKKVAILVSEVQFPKTSAHMYLLLVAHQVLGNFCQNSYVIHCRGRGFLSCTYNHHDNSTLRSKCPHLIL